MSLSNIVRPGDGIHVIDLPPGVLGQNSTGRQERDGWMRFDTRVGFCAPIAKTVIEWTFLSARRV